MRFLLTALIVSLAMLSSAERVVIGHLGQTLKSTPIYTAPNAKAQIYYRAKAYEYIVVKAEPKMGFMQVLMANGKYGYAPEKVIAKLPYEAVSDRPVVARDWGAVSSRKSMADYSLQFKGTPYKWGGNDPNNGIDCSGFVKYLYGKIGISLPRTAAEQVRVGQPITKFEDLLPGDRLYFWSKTRNKVGHTGIYLGGGYFSHSSTGRGGVATDFLGGKYWRETLVAARR